MKAHMVDVTGLPIDAAMEIAARDFLHSGTAALLHTAKRLSRDGADRDTINAILERERAELEAWRVKSLAELRCWLEREGQGLN